MTQDRMPAPHSGAGHEETKPPRGRVQRRREKDWRLPANTVYVGRNTIRGNPWRGPDAVTAYRRFMQQVLDGVVCQQLIEQDLDVRIVFWKPLVRWQELRKLVLPTSQLTYSVCCWCGLDKECHGDVWLEVADGRLRPTPVEVRA